MLVLSNGSESNGQETIYKMSTNLTEIGIHQPMRYLTREYNNTRVLLNENGLWMCTAKDEPMHIMYAQFFRSHCP